MEYLGVPDISMTLLEWFSSKISIRKAYKDKYGEVFTPFSLIEEMLDNIPDAFWRNPENKIFDPATGFGQFPVYAYCKLFKNLKEWEPDDIKRKNHIIKNMLYMVEYQEDSYSIIRKIFGEDANLLHCSFIPGKDYTRVFDENVHFTNGARAFDLIMGNPPWNKPQEGLRKGSYGGKTLWDSFVVKGLKLLNENAILTFIHPANWRGLGELHPLWNLLTQRQIEYLHMYSKTDGLRIFNVGSRFDLYVLKNTKNTKPTKVIDELGDRHLLQINDVPFLSNYAYDDLYKILTTKDKGINVIYSRSLYGTDKPNMNSIETNIFKYPVIHSIGKNGIRYWYSNDSSKGHFGIPKVILNFNEKQYSHKEQNDYEGKFGMSQISFGIPIKSREEGDMILRAMDTLIFKRIISSTKWAAFQTDYRMFRYFRPDWYKIILDETGGH